MIEPVSRTLPHLHAVRVATGGRGLERGDVLFVPIEGHFGAVYEVRCTRPPQTALAVFCRASDQIAEARPIGEGKDIAVVCRLWYPEFDFGPADHDGGWYFVVEDFDSCAP